MGADGEAATPETSRFTSAYQRIPANQEELAAGAKAAKTRQAAQVKAPCAAARDDRLRPVEQEQTKAGGRAATPVPQSRASNLGFLPLTLAEYLRLLDRPAARRWAPFFAALAGDTSASSVQAQHSSW